jgi:DtxR family Mn-dependent transcriptional regulator
VSGLIDTTEMYLRTIYELEEEGVPPLRARIAERLHQSGPTVSQTVGRLEREGLLTVADDRNLVLSERGRHVATSVMRKHRLAELLLTEIIGLEWEQVHLEACRWEHVISDAVERRLVEMLGNPTTCPHGNPIPGLSDLAATPTGPAHVALVPMTEAAARGGSAVVRRISEQLQVDQELMADLARSAVRPGAAVRLRPVDGGGVEVSRDGEPVVALPRDVASHIFVSLEAAAAPVGVAAG